MRKVEIVVPSFSGHVEQARNFYRSAEKLDSAHLMRFVLAREDVRHFDFVPAASILLIEELVEKEIGEAIEAGPFLRKVGKFKYQGLKKMLGVAASDADIAVVMDSESELVAPFDPERLSRIIIPYRDFAISQNKDSLQRQAIDECNYLLGDTGDTYFFESYNWFYLPSLMRETIDHITGKHGTRWLHRAKPGFECQLYFKHAYNLGAPYYEFVPTETLLTEAVGKERAALIRTRMENSDYRETATFEYVSSFVEPDLLEDLYRSPRIRAANLLRRFETPFFSPMRLPAEVETEGAFGLVSMHRKSLTKKMAAVYTGQFANIDQVVNAKTLLEGIEADVFVVTEDSFLIPHIKDMLKPKRLVIANPSRVEPLEDSIGFTEDGLKLNRNVNTLRMIDKMALSVDAILDAETEDGAQYGTIMRLRPDIYPLQSLFRALLVAAEYPNWTDSILFPNRMFSLGVNDQMFLGSRESMLRLLREFTPENAARHRFFNPEFILAEMLLALKLKPITFEFQYVLGRNLPFISHTLYQFGQQEALWWARTTPYPPHSDLSNQTALNVDSVFAIACLKADLKRRGVRSMRSKEGATVSTTANGDGLIIRVPEGVYRQEATRSGLDRLPGDEYVFTTQSYDPAVTGIRLSLRLPRPRSIRVKREILESFRLSVDLEADTLEVNELKILFFKTNNFTNTVATLDLSF